MKRNSWVFMMTGILLFAMFLIPGKVYGTVFVDVNAPVGTNDGSSWTNAYLTIQAGIDASAPGDEIWVADGTYFEAIVLADTGDILYGGFEGHGGAAETLLSQRDWQNNESTVDASTADAGNPAIHVVSMVASVNTRFDGFTVTGGHADGAAIPDDSAAGIFLINTNDTNIVTNCLVRDNVANYGGGGIGGAYSDAQIIDCTITENYAYDGAGIAWPYGILNISGCTITGNIATRSGGGISGIECGSVTISDCVITGNEAPEGGAGVGFYDSPLTIIDCDISNNTGTTDGPGAGVFLENQISGNSLEIAGCVINNNNVTAPGPRSENEGDGGAVYFLDTFSASATFSDCIFEGNSAQEGGGLYVLTMGSITLDTCIIGQNTSEYVGGAILIGNSIGITQCIIYENSAVNSAGGLYLEGAGAEVTHCTVTGNTTDSTGGGIICEGSSNFIRNVIFEGNTNHAVAETSSSADLSLENCLFFNNIDGAYLDHGFPSTSYADADMASLNSTVPEATDNITGDPAFLDKAAGNFHLTGCSAAIDMAVLTALTEDFDGNLRPVDIPGIGISGYDIGAYELSTTNVFQQQPQGARKYDGDTHDFTVGIVDAGCALTYQWKWDDGVSPVADVGTASTLSLADVTGLAGTYWCEILYGGGIYISDTAILEVMSPMQITVQPVGGDKEEGSSHTFTVTVTGGYAPLLYSWKQDGNTVSSEEVYTLLNLSISDTGSYTVDILDDSSDSVQSIPVTLTVTVSPVPTAGFGALAFLAAGLAWMGSRATRKKK